MLFDFSASWKLTAWKIQLQQRGHDQNNLRFLLAQESWVNFAISVNFITKHIKINDFVFNIKF